MKLIVELRAGTGGIDAEDLVFMQFDVYKKFARLQNIEIEILDYQSGFVCFRATGKKAKLFSKEIGGIRVQRIPPSERKGRVHTSNITVAVLPEPQEYELIIDPRDLEYKATRGSGAGGQHRNKVETAIQLKHLPTGLQVRAEAERSQAQNKEIALNILRAKLYELGLNSKLKEEAELRKGQIGTAMRADKRRTIRFQDDLVIDHISDKKTTAKNYLKGLIDLLY